MDPLIFGLDLYNSKLEAGRENFERALSFPTAEDYIYKTFVE